MSVKLNILSVLSLNYVLFNEKYRQNLEKFPSFLNIQSSLQHCQEFLSRLLLFSVLPGSIDTHHCSSSPPFPLHPHSHMTNFFHSITRTTTQLLHPTHYLALLSLFCHIAQQPKDRNWQLCMLFYMLYLFLKNIEGKFIAFQLTRRVNTVLLLQLELAPSFVLQSLSLFLCNVFTTPLKQQHLILTLHYYITPLCFTPAHPLV